ncbi:hypothetical protein AE921_20600 [Xanthomonas arboricola]|uniref:hypothetical protein n=1 Tax=Xanthomonas arboricola TaxID=56448 RepID=UPI00069ECC36|nr:hypothetical protein [Xanthomonas arboricola]KOA96286.1 hypothetical protein AE921_20600 [Xanthomonas arboricola]KOB04246.1 hypothetical protein AE923_22025 [Xanthomonas arboricola]KOB04449.1 hypothetical protein AE922_20560 [Xanthomonas arboricola]KOB15116.1 hypothetical protein AE925_18115 [Xanthomonas arboricola]KOB21802.1 hypothetical protein AE926_17285 [Xanthomonas arboricola]
MKDTNDLETWLIEFGDEIIHKEHQLGATNISAVETAVYDLWAVDYAVRNAGDMEALEDFRPTAAINLAEFLSTIGQSDLASYMASLSSAGDACDSYYARFSELCEALQGSLRGA